MALSVPLSRFTPRVGGGSAFFVRRQDIPHIMATDSQKQRTCSECGSTDIVVGIAVTKNADSGHIGLSYKALAIVRGTEQLYADLCKSVSEKGRHGENHARRRS